MPPRVSRIIAPDRGRIDAAGVPGAVDADGAQREPRLVQLGQARASTGSSGVPSTIAGRPRAPAVTNRKVRLCRSSWLTVGVGVAVLVGSGWAGVVVVVGVAVTDTSTVSVCTASRWEPIRL